MHVKSPGDIGRLIRDARARAGMSQAALGARIGTTQSWVSEVENGKATAEIGMVLKVLSYLGLDLDLSDRHGRRSIGHPAHSNERFPDIDDIVAGGPRRS